MAWPPLPSNKRSRLTRLTSWVAWHKGVLTFAVAFVVVLSAALLAIATRGDESRELTAAEASKGSLESASMSEGASSTIGTPRVGGEAPWSTGMRVGTPSR